MFIEWLTLLNSNRLGFQEKTAKRIPIRVSPHPTLELSTLVQPVFLKQYISLPTTTIVFQNSQKRVHSHLQIQPTVFYICASLSKMLIGDCYCRQRTKTVMGANGMNFNYLQKTCKEPCTYRRSGNILYVCYLR